MAARDTAKRRELEAAWRKVKAQLHLFEEPR